MAKIVNLTPHEINIYEDDRHIKDIPVSGLPVPRCHQSQALVGYVDDIEITRQSFGEVENLPAPKVGTFFVVSRMVAEAVPERGDLLVPGPLVRDHDGKPCGCRGLAIIKKMDLEDEYGVLVFGKYKPNDAYIDAVTGNEVYTFTFSNKYGASVVRGKRTYGGAQGFFELAVLHNGEITTDTPITTDVLGWLSDDEVLELLQRIEALE